MIPLTGYSDRLSVCPGESIEFKISSQLASDYEARLIKIRCADPNPDGPGMRETHVPSSLEGTYASRNQVFTKGSYAVVRSIEAATADIVSFVVSVVIWPTLPGGSKQTILSHEGDSMGFRIFLDEDARLNAIVGASKVVSEKSLRERCWYGIELTLVETQLKLEVWSIEKRGQVRVLHESILVDVFESQSIFTNAPLLIAARHQTEEFVDFFNGKIESPSLIRLSGGEREICFEFDFSKDMSGTSIVDVGPSGLRGQIFNQPARAMKGSAWDGSELCWRHKPSHYAAIHFHDDDVSDCGWETDFVFEVPADLQSGIYAVHLSCEGVEDRIPFFVRPPRGMRQNNVCFLAPTFTYVIYGNQARNQTDELYLQRVHEWLDARVWNTDQDQDYGLSTYNRHTDNSGICYASRNRPMITTFRPGYVWVATDYSESGVRHFAADTHITDWLEQMDFGYDVITDDDLHAEGAEILDDYDVVITGTHPEYHTENTLDGVETYLDGGGRLMYLGGNGFYWRIGINPDVDGVLEIRRPNGLGIWKGDPGEDYNSLDGEMGGIWRLQGRPPQELVGIGFSSQGDYVGSNYVKQPDAAHPAVSWIFDGVEDEVIGDFGLCGGGAAGYELDRADPLLGTPEKTWVLARADGNPKQFFAVTEDVLFTDRTYPRKPSPPFTTESAAQFLHADMVYCERPTGGTVFSTGSITYAGALSHNNYNNNVSQITRNVLDGFTRKDNSL